MVVDVDVAGLRNGKSMPPYGSRGEGNDPTALAKKPRRLDGFLN